MLENVKVNWQSSVRIEHNGAVIYIDPWKITDCHDDADVVCITHSHYDHFSPEDAALVSHPGTLVLAPVSIADEVTQKLVTLEDDNFEFLEAGDEIDIDDIHIEAVPAYNIGKPFHKPEYGWLGYIVELGGLRYYIAGDTDANEEIKKIKCDVAIIPIGGKYTMDADEAAELVNEIAPKYVIPTHFGCVEGAGSKDDDSKFADKIKGNTEIIFKLHK